MGEPAGGKLKMVNLINITFLYFPELFREYHFKEIDQTTH